MRFPEVPLLVYPSLARRLGVEESILYYICEQLMSMQSPQINTQVSVSWPKWQMLSSIWDAQKLSSLIASLKSQGIIDIVISGQQILITPLEISQTTEGDSNFSKQKNNFVSEAGREPTIVAVAQVESLASVEQGFDSAIEQTQILPVYDVPPAPPSRPLPVRRASELPIKNITINSGEILKGIGPAPSFGRYRRESNAHDPFRQLLDDREQQNKKLFAMTMEWKPSKLLIGTLARNNIPHDVAISYLDEFRLYYCDRNNKERSWDQKFLAWVKNAWVKKQSADNRAQNVSSQAGFKHENSQRDSREKRKRITAAIMDIHDTSW